MNHIVSIKRHLMFSWYFSTVQLSLSRERHVYVKHG